MKDLLDLSPQVFNKDGKATTTSLAIAEFFGKRHSHVLRAVKNLECSKEFNERNFGLVEYTDAKGEKRPMYEITKDGFVFLVMGFTGKGAAKFKESYINAFNEMQSFIENKQEALMLNLARVEQAHKLATEKASDAGRNLNWLGKKVKPELKSEIESIIAQLQPNLPFEEDLR